MPQGVPTASDLMRISRELMIAEIEEFYAASEPISFELADEEVAA
jgi:hypothetical protein